MSGFFRVDPNKMKDLAKDASGDGGSGSGEWFKPERGENIIRICPPWSAEGSPYRKLVSHNGPFTSPFMSKDGKRVAPLCLRYLFGQAHLEEIAIRSGKITEEDRELYEQFGCPLDRLPQYYQSLGDEKSKKVAGNHWPRTQYVWNVINRKDGKLYKWSCSKKLAKPIEATFALYDKLFDPDEGRDIFITATGEGKDRRYESPIVSPGNSPIRYSGSLNDLDNVMLIGIRGFDELVELAATNNLNESLEARLGPALIEYAEAKGII